VADQPRTARTTTTDGKDPMATTTQAPPAQAEAGAAAKGGGRKKMMVIAVVVLVAVAAAYMLVLKPKDKPAAPPKPVPGAVVKLDPITINLAGGHFLKLGLSLQATADAGEDVPGAKALDAAIDMFSGRTVDSLAKRDGREKAKAALVKEISDRYENKIYDIYFTDFVMQ
jgi:flagellar FliL protein